MTLSFKSHSLQLLMLFKVSVSQPRSGRFSSISFKSLLDVGIVVSASVVVSLIFSFFILYSYRN